MKGCNNRIPQRNVRTGGHTTSKRSDNRNKNVEWKCEDWLLRKADHACIHPLQERRWKKQIHQISEHVEKRIKRKEVKDNSINGRRRKIPSEKNGYVKNCIHVNKDILLDLISMNSTLKHVSVICQIMVKICQSGSLKYIKYQDIETEVENQMEKWQSTNSS